MTFSAIVPVRDSSRTLTRCLRSLRAAGGDGLELIVVDDGSTDDSAELARPWADKVISTHHRGASGARNLGARHAAGDVLVFADSDVQVPSDAFSLLADALAGAGSPEAVQGIYSADCPHPNAASQYKNLYYHYSWTRRVRNRHLTSAASFLLAVRSKVFRELGGFDEQIRQPTVEDADLGHRLVGRGGTILLDPRLQVVHDRYYGLLELLRYDRRLAAAKTRFILRRLARRDMGVVHPTTGWAVSTARAIEMVPWLASLGLLPVALLAGALRFWPVAGIAALAIPLLHAPFLLFVARTGGLGLACRTAFITFADAAAVDVGIVSGLVSFLAGREY
jgi:glycosyltransferase involved in cell wall biosynthesis